MYNLLIQYILKKEYVTSILIYFDMLEKGNEYQDYNDHIIEACMVHLEKFLNDEDMFDFLTHLTNKYTIKHGINGKMLRDEWLSYWQEQKNKIVPLPPF